MFISADKIKQRSFYENKISIKFCYKYLWFLVPKYLENRVKKPTNIAKKFLCVPLRIFCLVPFVNTPCK